MDIIKVKIPVGSDGLVKKKFLANPSGEKGVGCAGGCIKIELGKNMMDQTRSFKASMNRGYTFEYSRTHLPHGKIPVDIIPGKTDPYLIVDELGDIFWVGNVNDQPDWTPGTDDKGQYKETKMKDGTTLYKLTKHLGEIVSPNSYTDFDRAEIVSNPGKSEEEEEWRGYPEIPSRQSSLKWIQKDDDVAKRIGEEEDELFAKRMGEKEDELFAIELQRKFDDIDATGNIRITKKKKRRRKKRDKKPKRKPTRKKRARKKPKRKPTRKKPKKKSVRKRVKKKSVRKRGKKKN